MSRQAVRALERCLSCRAFLARDRQTAEGYDCPACLDEWHNGNLEANGWSFDSELGVWVKPLDGGA